MKKNNNDQIKTERHTHCYICNSDGKILYKELKDNIFNTKGKWDILICNNSECGLLWLDPMPLDEEVYKLYDKYYTHTDEIIIQDFKQKRGIQLILHKIYNLIDIITFTKYEKDILNHFYLHKTKPGRLLEIGCGNGKRLNDMKLLGWEVEGQEIDYVSAKFAQEKYNLNVHIGALEKLKLKNEYYDAIVLNHVLEHIYNPLNLILKCIKLLKKGGKLIIITPNFKSFGNKIFSKFWYFLDPPRHLNIFNSDNLFKLFNKTELKNIYIKTSSVNTEIVSIGSLRIKNKFLSKKNQKSEIKIHILSLFIHLLSRILFIFKSSLGDECILIGKK